MSGGKFWDGPTYKIVKAMKATGNQPGVIAQWKAMIEEWAHTPPFDADKLAVQAWLPAWQVRPFYTAAELAPLFPALAVALRFTDRPPPQMGAARLRSALTYAGLPSLMWSGTTYFIVERIRYWRDAPDAEIQQEFFNAQHG